MITRIIKASNRSIDRKSLTWGASSNKVNFRIAFQYLLYFIITYSPYIASNNFCLFMIFFICICILFYKLICKDREKTCLFKTARQTSSSRKEIYHIMS